MKGMTLKLVILGSVVAASSLAMAQQSRGSLIVGNIVFDQSGTQTSRATAAASINEILQKGGFKMVGTARTSQHRSAYLPSSASLAAIGRRAGAKYVAGASVTFHSRSIWVNLGPKTVSNCTIRTIIVNSATGKTIYTGTGVGRSDEKDNTLKDVGAVLVTPLITVVSGGPKTPQEQRAAQIAAARALRKFLVIR